MQKINDFVKFDEKMRAKIKPYLALTNKYREWSREEKNETLRFFDAELSATIEEKKEFLENLWEWDREEFFSNDARSITHQILNQQNPKFIASMLEKINKQYDGKYVYGPIKTIFSHGTYAPSENGSGFNYEKAEYDHRLIELNAIHDARLNEDLKNKDEYGMIKTIARYSNQGKLYIIKDKKYQTESKQRFSELDNIYGRTFSVSNNSGAPVKNGTFGLGCGSYYSNDKKQDKADGEMGQKNGELILQSYLQTVE